MCDPSAYESERLRMVSEQLVWRGIHDSRLLKAMRTVPRHCFVPLDYRPDAYADCPLPIGEGQTISQPYIVALMTELLGLHGEEKVLEVGTGSGYQAAVLAHLAQEVHTVERHANLAEKARRVLEELGLENVHVHVGDGSKGLPEHAPYQGILVTASAPRVPQPLLDQLVEEGRLILPVGSRFSQTLELWQRHGGDFSCEGVIPVAFVPLRGEFGWKEESQWHG